MATPSLATVGGAQFATGYPGQLAGNPNDCIIESRNNEAAGAIDYGDPVARGVATVPGVIGNCKVPVASAVIIGIAVRQLSEANAASGNTVNYPQNKTVPILKDGDIWVIAGEAVAEGDDALAIVGTTGVGSVQTSATTATRIALPGAKWQQTVTIGNVGLLRVKNA